MQQTAHAATAAILRSGYDPDHLDAAAVDLSSARVRRTKWLLDGIRHGQSLGSLLGYRVERRLQDASRLATYIVKFRMLAASRDDGLVATAMTALDDAEHLVLVRQIETTAWNDANSVYQAAVATTADAQADIYRYAAVAAAEKNLVSSNGIAEVALGDAVIAAATHRKTRPRTTSSMAAGKINSEIPDDTEIKPWNDAHAGDAPVVAGAASWTYSAMPVTWSAPGAGARGGSGDDVSDYAGVFEYNLNDTEVLTLLLGKSRNRACERGKRLALPN